MISEKGDGGVMKIKTRRVLNPVLADRDYTISVIIWRSCIIIGRTGVSHYDPNERTGQH